MDSTDQAAIIIHRPTNYLFGRSRSFLAWIDGRRVGKVRPGAMAEFTVAPGEHTVAVSMDWLGSRPLQVIAAAGVRTELTIGAPSGVTLKVFLPIFVAALGGLFLMEILRTTTDLAYAPWWLRGLLFVAVYVAFFKGYVLLTAKFLRDYWSVWSLEPARTPSPQVPIGG